MVTDGSHVNDQGVIAKESLLTYIIVVWRLHNDAQADIQSTAVPESATNSRGCHSLLTDHTG
jgi:hypothetical protein